MQQTNPKFENFAGFQSGAFDFFRKLHRNNNRPWFLKHKDSFQETLLKPMRALAFEWAEALHDKGIPLEPSAKSPVSRIYRDLRFSPDKRPYNTFLSTALYRKGNKSLPGVLYLHLAASEAFVASGFWQPEPAFLLAWRSTMTSRPAAFSKVVAELKRQRLQLSTESAMKRLPRGFDVQVGSPMESFLKLKSFIVTRKLSQKEVYSPRLVETITKFAVESKPLLEFGWALRLPRKTPSAHPTFEETLLE